MWIAYFCILPKILTRLIWQFIFYVLNLQEDEPIGIVSLQLRVFKWGGGVAELQATEIYLSKINY
jgi:hypothetical protein